MKRSKLFAIPHEHRDMIKDLLRVSEEVLRKRRKREVHLRFAKPAIHGWSFFKKKRPLWDVLDEITTKASSLHPHLPKGTIAHVLSELVNLAKRDLAALQAEL